MANDNFTISDLALEQFRLGELPPEHQKFVQGRLAADPAVSARLATLTDSDREMAASGMLERLSQVVQPRPHGTRRWQVALGAAAVVVAAIWLPGVIGRGGRVPSGAEVDRVKGEAASLMLYRKTDTGSELLTDGAPARRGDLIRVAYRAARQCYGVIVSIDGAGVVTRHMPADTPIATALQPGDSTPLAAAFELDDAPTGERFFLVTSDDVFDVAVVVEAARRTDVSATGLPTTLPLPEGLQQSTFLLRKVF
jgi:hypothetical protein